MAYDVLGVFNGTESTTLLKREIEKQTVPMFVTAEFTQQAYKLIQRYGRGNKGGYAFRKAFPANAQDMASFVQREFEIGRKTYPGTMNPTDFDATAFETQFKKTIEDASLAEIYTFAINVWLEAQMTDIVETWWLGDKTKLFAAVVPLADGTNSVIGDPDIRYNMVDGILTQLTAEAVATPDIAAGEMLLIDIADPLVAGTAIALAEEMVQKRPYTINEAYKKNNLVFYFSRNLFDNYIASLKNLGNGDTNRVQIVDGIRQTSYDGIVIEEVDLRNLLDSDFGGNYEFAILTEKGNLIQVLSTNTDKTNLDAGYDRKDQFNWVRLNAAFGAGYKFPDKIVFARTPVAP